MSGYTLNIALTAIIAASLFGAAFIIRYSRTHEHRHDWTELAISFRPVTLIQAFSETDPRTYVLRRCVVCHELNTLVLAGSWVQSDLAGGEVIEGAHDGVLATSDQLNPD